MSVEAILGFLERLPPLPVYVVIGVGAALENLLPPVPADTFVLLGGFLAARGAAELWIVWAVTFLFNVGSALLVYWIGYRYGRRFFESGLGRHVLNEHQLRRMGYFYHRFGVFAVFFARFLPGLRAVVPGFAGVSHQPFVPVAIPVAAASALWYGALVWLGATAGRNLEKVLGWLEHANLALLAAAVVVCATVLGWWLRTRGGGRRDG